MKYLFGILCALFQWTTAFGQTFFVETKQLPIKEYVKLENRLHSKTEPDKNVSFLGAAYTFGPTRQFARTNTAIRPRPLIQYVYSLPDSVVRIIQLDVDSLNYLGYLAKDRAGYHESQARHKSFLAVYKLAQQELTALLGKSKTSEPEHKVVSETGEYYEQADYWDTPELTAQVYSVFSIVSRQNGSDAYRVRAEIRYKNPVKPAATINSVANPKQEAAAQRFLTLLLTGKYADSWQLVGPSIKQSATYEQYEAALAPFFTKLTDTDKGVSLFMSGPSINANGQTYAVYAYKLNADAASPPKTIFNILFEDFETELIGGVQPQSRMEKIPISK